MIERGIAKQGRRDSHRFGICKQGTVGVDIDGRHGWGKDGVVRLRRLVKFLLCFNHLRKVMHKGGEVYERPNWGICGINPIYHYDVTKSNDGVGGEEGTFCLCMLWYTA